jgi:uncharacterized MAPEG superfamily protein
MPNLSAWCLLAAALMPIVCAGIAKGGTFSKPPGEGGFDNRQPREWLARQQGWRQRANAAQANCFEALPFFVGALLYAQHAGAPESRVGLLALLFVALRAIYVALYLTDRPMPRTVAWTAAIAVNIALLFSAG